MSEIKGQMGDSEPAAVLAAERILGSVGKNEKNRLALETVSSQIHILAETIMFTKGNQQDPDLKQPSYIRGITDGVNLSTRLGAVKLFLFEQVRTDLWPTAGGEERAIVDGYFILAQLPGASDYTRMFEIGERTQRITGWRGQDVDLPEAKMAISLLKHIDRNLPPRYNFQNQ